MTESEAGTRTISVRVPADLADWVDEEFPHGFKQTFGLQCFLSLRYVMTEGELPPFNEYARRASIEAIQALANPVSRNDDQSGRTGQEVHVPSSEGRTAGDVHGTS